MAVSAASDVAAVVAAFGVSSQDTATGSTAVRADRGGAGRPGLLPLPREVLSPACVDHSQFLPSTLSIQAWNGTQPQLQCDERRHVFSEVEQILALVTAVLHVGRVAFRATSRSKFNSILAARQAALDRRAGRRLRLRRTGRRWSTQPLSASSA